MSGSGNGRLLTKQTVQQHLRLIRLTPFDKDRGIKQPGLRAEASAVKDGFNRLKCGFEIAFGVLLVRLRQGRLLQLPPVPIPDGENGRREDDQDRKCQSAEDLGAIATDELV